MRPLGACLIMAVGVSAARPICAGLTPLMRLTVEIGLGALLYTSGVLLLAPSDCNELVRTARAALATAS
jgi:hypothetical protein